MKNCRLKFNLLLGNGNLLDVPLVIAGNHFDTVSVRKHADNRPVCPILGCTVSLSDRL